MECIICFIDVSYNNYLCTECCQQIIHIDCLKNWIELNLNINTDIHKCFYCKNNNVYINNIIHLLRNESTQNIITNIDNNDTTINMQLYDYERNNNNININTDINNINNNDSSYYQKCCGILFFVGALIIFFLVIILSN